MWAAADRFILRVFLISYFFPVFKDAPSFHAFDSACSGGFFGIWLS